MSSASWLAEGKILLHPTEGVWGIGCDALNEKSFLRVYELKKRPRNKSFIVLIKSLESVKKFVTIDNLIAKTKKLQNSLIRDFGIRSPKIAILGLNPHAGENGLLGKEEIEFIVPAIKLLKEEKILAFGPYPADSFFTSKNLSLRDYCPTAPQRHSKDGTWSN